MLACCWQRQTSSTCFSLQPCGNLPYDADGELGPVHEPLVVLLHASSLSMGAVSSSWLLVRSHNVRLDGFGDLGDRGFQRSSLQAGGEAVNAAGGAVWPALARSLAAGSRPNRPQRHLFGIVLLF